MIAASMKNKKEATPTEPKAAADIAAEEVAKMPSDDIEALDRLLSEWSAQDALTVLDEIDYRIGTVR